MAVDLIRRARRGVRAERRELGEHSEQSTRALAYLRMARSQSRYEKRKNVALAVYGVALVGTFWGIPALLAAARAGRAAGRHGPVAEHVLMSLPVAMPVLLLLVLLLMARGAVWRGPVLLDMPTVSWLLPTPLSRASVLLSRLLASVLVAGAVGLVVGGALGFLLYGTSATSWPVVTAAGAWAGVAAAITGCAAGALVERHDRPLARHGARLFGAAWALVAVLAVVAVVSAVRGAPTWLGPLFLWSGPWGWAAQPLVAAMGDGAPWWPAGAALSAGWMLAALLLARRETPRISAAALRLRTTVASQVTASLFMLDLRQARSGVPALRERGSRPALRLPMPGRPWLVVPWRDATGLLRAPGRLGWAAAWVAAAVALTVLAPTVREDARSLAAVAALLAGYLAAAQLAEPARVESDDLRRSANLPYPAKSLALRHALVPGTLLLAGLAAGAAVSALSGWGRPGLVALVAAAPALLAAALVSAYRGTVPPHILIGSHTPMGNTGPFQTLVWYVRGPLAALVLTAPVLVSVVHGGAYGAVQSLWQLLVGAVGLWWVRRTAHRLYSG
ncbi:DUF6297 family protein [Streptomyces sp. NPDC088400]|uniref:DUF6297 family protein n=1 Tax=Streptomyces sp. NPDC088400 TaxID=3365861 RepID=UPI0038118AF1